MKNMCVVGLGYIGLPTASLFANNGFHVRGVDTNAHIVELINAGRNHVQEVGLRTLVESAIGSGHLAASLKPDKADVFIIAVPTPFRGNKEPDLSYVYDATQAILPFLEPGNIVVVESTVPPGTTRHVAERIAEGRPDLVGERSRPVETLKVDVAHCPERVLPGRILMELVENDRVIGGLTPEGCKRTTAVYKTIVAGNIFETDATTAEMVKLSENTFRDINISFANELAVICQKLGINAWEVIELANKHPRVRILNPGPGVGGHCIAVDPWFIVAEFPEDAQVIRAARLRNDSIPRKVVDAVQRIVRDEKSPKIACLGASYKGNVGDARNSPAVEIFEMLSSEMKAGGEVAINDMYVTDSHLPLQPLSTVLEQASLIVILADHFEYKALDPFELASKVSKKRVFDTRHVINKKKWESAGFEVQVLGDGSPSAQIASPA